MIRRLTIIGLVFAIIAFVTALACRADEASDWADAIYIHGQTPAPTVVVKTPEGPVDGQLSPKGQWRYSAAQRAWQPTGTWITQKFNCTRAGCQTRLVWIPNSP